MYASTNVESVPEPARGTPTPRKRAAVRITTIDVARVFLVMQESAWPRR
jgi:hypothetical protein